MLESLVFLFLVFVMFSAGPLALLLGACKRSPLIAVVGCVICWASLAYFGTFSIVFNPISIIPLITLAFVSTLGVVMVVRGVFKQKKAG